MGKSKIAKNTDAGTIEVDPIIVRFTHARIRPYFSGCGRRLDDTLNDIVNGVSHVVDLPLIVVLSINGEYYSLNNRRLYVLKQLHSRGLLATVRVRVKQPADKEKLRYTPERCSLTASVMKEHARSEQDSDEDGL